MLLKLFFSGFPFAVTFANVINFFKSRVFRVYSFKTINYTSKVFKAAKRLVFALIGVPLHHGFRGCMVVCFHRQFPFRKYRLTYPPRRRGRLHRICVKTQ